MTESYRIEHPFEIKTSGEKHLVVSAEYIEDHLTNIDTPARKTPLSLEYPVDATQRIRIRCADKLPVRDDDVKVDTRPTFNAIRARRIPGRTSFSNITTVR